MSPSILSHIVPIFGFFVWKIYRFESCTAIKSTLGGNLILKVVWMTIFWQRSSRKKNNPEQSSCLVTPMYLVCFFHCLKPELAPLINFVTVVWCLLSGLAQLSSCNGVLLSVHWRSTESGSTIGRWAWWNWPVRARHTALPSSLVSGIVDSTLLLEYFCEQLN